MCAKCSPPLKILYYIFSEFEKAYEILLKIFTKSIFSESKSEFYAENGKFYILYTTDMMMSDQVYSFRFVVPV